MLAFCHLFVGAVIGLLLYAYLKDRRVVVLAGIGAWLPDLVDKPLGHIVLRTTLDDGRIFAHSLLFVLLILAVGLVLWNRRDNFLVLAVAIGVLSHLYLDAMWELPVTLFYPLLGPFPQMHFPGYLESSLLNEITAPTEWLFALTALWIVLRIRRQELEGRWKRLEASLTLIAPAVLGTTFAFGLLYLAAGLFDPGILGMSAGNSVILGLASIAGSYVLIANLPSRLVRAQVPEAQD